MAGKPIFNRMCRQIEELGGDDWVFSQIAAGRRIADIAGELGVDRRLLYFWRKKKPGRIEAWEEAMRLSAHAKVEEAEEILDLLEKRLVTPAEVAAARSRAEFKKWLASKRNREEYGDTPAAALQLNVSLGSLHLDALRAHGSMSKAKELEMLPAEVVEESE